jgi:hypothetical protein
MATDKGPPIQKVARPPVNTPDGCHRNSLENSNICVFGNIQTLTRVFLPETNMCLSQRNLGAPPAARGPQSKEPNNEDYTRSVRATARVDTRDTNGSPRATQQKRRSSAHRHSITSRQSTAGIRDCGPRDHGSALERRLHDGPRPQRVRRADVDLWQQRRTRAIQKCILTCSRLAPMTSTRETHAPEPFSIHKRQVVSALPIRIRIARLSLLAAFASGMAASLSPETAHAQEYPWCVSRESYLDCAYTTHEQCQWTASGTAGCALTPRLLSPNTSRHPEATPKNQPKKTYRAGCNRCDPEALPIYRPAHPRYCGPRQACEHKPPLRARRD